MRDRIFALMIVIAMPLAAQPPQGGRGGPPQSPQTMAPVDLTGYWVAIVSEDWRFRMITPSKGDYPDIQPILNDAGKKIADAWDPAKDEAAGEQCKGYGAANLMRIPTRLHITWANDTTLKLDTDAGTQTRLFHFTSRPSASAARSWQGESTATWEPATAAGGGGGSLRVVSPAGGGTSVVAEIPTRRA